MHILFDLIFEPSEKDSKNKDSWFIPNLYRYLWPNKEKEKEKEKKKNIELKVLLKKNLKKKQNNDI